MKKAILVVALALCLVGCDAAPVSETESTKPESNEESSISAEESAVSDGESEPVEEGTVEGTWRAVTNVSAVIREQWESVCPELPLADTEITLPVIVTIGEDTMNVKFDNIERVMFDLFLERMPDYMLSRWGNKVGDKTLDEFLTYSGITPGGLLQMLLMKACFSEIKFQTQKEDGRLVSPDGIYLYRFEDGKMELRADDESLLSEIFPLTFTKVELEKEEAIGKTVLRYYWDGKDDVTIVSSTDTNITTKRVVNKKTVMEQTDSYSKNGNLEVTLIKEIYPEKNYTFDSTIFYEQVGNKTVVTTHSVRFSGNGEEWMTVASNDSKRGMIFHTSVNATLDGHIGDRQFYEYPEQNNGSCFEGGFYALDRRLIDIVYYNAACEQIGSAYTYENNADLMCVRKGKKYFLSMREGLHITITDEKNALVARIEISGMQAQLVEAGEGYRDDLDELIAIYNQFYMND